MAVKKTYKQLRQELEEVLDWFESDDVDVEQALDKHAQATELIKQLEKYLADVELKISKAS